MILKKKIVVKHYSYLHSELQHSKLGLGDKESPLSPLFSPIMTTFEYSRVII